jgi:hypothetical protein
LELVESLQHVSSLLAEEGRAVVSRPCTWIVLWYSGCVGFLHVWFSWLDSFVLGSKKRTHRTQLLSCTEIRLFWLTKTDTFSFQRVFSLLFFKRQLSSFDWCRKSVSLPIEKQLAVC